MVPDEQTLSNCLEKYIQARLEEIPASESRQRNPGSRANTSSGDSRRETANEASRKRAERYQYAIWRMKDRLSYGIFGASSERLVDDFLARFGIEVEKRSEGYYRILRRVLQTEMDCYSILIQRENGDPEAVRDYYRRVLQGRKNPGSC